MKKKYFFRTVGIMILSILFIFAGTAPAKGPKANGPAEKAKGPHEKATGEVGYNAYGLFRWIEFNAHEQSEKCQATWNLAGDWVISVDYNGTKYNHDMTITDQEKDGALTGEGGWRAGELYNVTWQLIDSYIDGENVHLELQYSNSNYIAALDGKIMSDGTIDGEWYSNTGQDGTWRITEGNASAQLTGCEGKGMLRYWDANGDWYDVDVVLVNVKDDEAWFAGPVVSASNSSWLSNWLFAKVYDGGEPAAGVDKVWGSFTSMEDAAAGVGFTLDPEAGPFTVEEGNLQVHTY